MIYRLPSHCFWNNRKWNLYLTLYPILVSETHFLLGELYIPRPIQVRSGYEANYNRGSILKNKINIALPRHDGEAQTNIFWSSSWSSLSCFTPLALVSCHWSRTYHNSLHHIYLKLFFSSLGTVIILIKFITKIAHVPITAGPLQKSFLRPWLGRLCVMTEPLKVAKFS